VKISKIDDPPENELKMIAKLEPVEEKVEAKKITFDTVLPPLEEATIEIEPLMEPKMEPKLELEEISLSELTSLDDVMHLNP